MVGQSHTHEPLLLLVVGLQVLLLQMRSEMPPSRLFFWNPVIGLVAEFTLTTRLGFQSIWEHLGFMASVKKIP